ncbi:oligosaccharide flippase family protein [Epibacterium sp. SM1969]|uniref:Oligosaccharide flippase family protein n=2 Tax=Tritonibacter aquimaris TaxID=2663379 RepID=A0A844ANX8_9RHOB|nr:oligosaccharide flippase family protein [Tritonibacter aquimaris]
MARALRSASWMVVGYGGSQALRLASNLLLTRILFPEAFGMMALVTVVTTGLMLFSDVGIGPAILQNKRGDDPEFLDTAWTIQVIRGGILWGITAILAWPVAQFYQTPELIYILPIAGIALAVEGFKPTRIETAHRHLMVGRVTILELISQLVSLVAMAILAIVTQSVIALVIGSVLQSVVYVIVTHINLPGHRNKFHWDKTAAQELIRFGKWIFLSTAFWFITSQGDRAILGKFIPLETLGIYNIAFFLASFPMALGYAVNQRLMIPVYRDGAESEGPGFKRKQRLLRLGLSTGLLLLLWTMALAGPWLVDLLYDARYQLAGAIIVPLSLSLAPAVIAMTYDQAALAAGDSKLFFAVSAVRAISQTAFFLIGVLNWGLPGGILAMGAAMLFTYPLIVALALKHKVWDPLHDVAMTLCCVAIGAVALKLHWVAIANMITELQN